MAYAVMLMLRQTMREQYRLAKERKAMREAEAAASPAKPAHGANALHAARDGAG